MRRKPGGDGRSDDIDFSMRAYTLPELVNMLHRCGFEPVDVWGGFDGSSYGLDSMRLMLLAEKPKG